MPAKKSRNKRAAMIGLAILAYAVIFAYLKINPESFSSGSYTAGMESLPAVTKVMTEMPKQLDQKVKTSDCHVSGPLPDHKCTPGAVFENTVLEKICRDGYTKTVRNVPTSLKKKIYKAYGISYPQPFGSYELDHLIPLSIGGSNAEANLFPEAKEPAPGFPEKDVVENYMHEETCSGHINIKEAQSAIASDWTKIYQNLSPGDIASLKSQFKSWANRISVPRRLRKL